jgi:hypothetical protein
MPRLTPAQICYGTLAAVCVTVALLALSGAHGLLAISLLVILGLTLGTIAVAVAITSPARHDAAPSRSRLVAAGNPSTAAPTVESIPDRENARR